MHRLRIIPFMLALIWALACVGFEIGSSKLVSPSDGAFDIAKYAGEDESMRNLSSEDKAKAIKDSGELGAETSSPPGHAVQALAFVDGLLLYSLLLVALGLIIPPGIEAKLHGVITFILALVVLILAITKILTWLVELLIMVTLFLSVPFGTIAYMVVYGFFNVGGATTLSSTILVFRLIAVISLILAQQKFLRLKALVALIITCFVAGWLVQFLLTIVPQFLASITDTLGAIIVGVLGAIWALVLLIMSIVSIIKALLSIGSRVTEAVA